MHYSIITSFIQLHCIYALYTLFIIIPAASIQNNSDLHLSLAEGWTVRWYQEQKSVILYVRLWSTVQE